MKASNWTKHASETRKDVVPTVGYRNFHNNPQVAITLYDSEKGQCMVIAMTGPEAKDLVIKLQEYTLLALNRNPLPTDGNGLTT